MFIGSSGFTRWTNTHSNWEKITPIPEEIVSNSGDRIAVNHGFGSSTMYELCYYYREMVQVFKTKVIVVSGLGNDWSYGYTQDEIMQYISWFENQSTKDFPNVQIYFTTIRPTPKDRTEAGLKRIFDLTSMMNEFAENHSNFHVIDIGQWEFFYKDKKDVGTYKNVRSDIYSSDNVHFVAETYDYYNEYFKKVLDQYL